MADYMEKDDLRVIKTHRGLLESFLIQIRNHNFKRITVNEICEDAQISRATFYSHFRDKYDLLEYWLSKLVKNISIDSSYEEIEDKINNFVLNNDIVIKHILDDADAETNDIVFNFLLEIIEATEEKRLCPTQSTKSIVVSHFCAGGFMSYIIWLVKNNFPGGVPAMNTYVYESLKILKTLSLEEKAERRFIY